MTGLRSPLRRLKYKVEGTSCILLPVEGDVRERILEVGKGIDPDLLTGYGHETDPHVTVLPCVPGYYPSRLTDLMSRWTRPIRFGVGRADVFSAPDHDVVFYAVTSPDLLVLHGYLRAALGSESEHPTYVPHVTVAYVRRGHGHRVAAQLPRIDAVVTPSHLVYSSPTRTRTAIDLPTDAPARYTVERPDEFTALMREWTTKAPLGEGDEEFRRVAGHLAETGHPFHRFFAAASVRGHEPVDAAYESGNGLKRIKSKHVEGQTDGDPSGGVYRMVPDVYKNGTAVVKLTTYSPGQDHYGIAQVPVYSKRDLDFLSEPLHPDDRTHLETHLRPHLPDAHPRDMTAATHDIALHHVTDGKMGTDPLTAGEMDWRPTEVTPEDHFAMKTSDRPVRYAVDTTNLTPHPLVAGFQLQHALEHIVRDEGFTDSGRLMAKDVLVNGNTEALWGLHDELHDHGHELKDRYNWLGAIPKLHLDAAVGKAIDAVAKRPYADFHPQQTAVFTLRMHNEGGGSEEPEDAHQSAAAESIKLLREKGHDRAAVAESLGRHIHRVMQPYRENRAAEEDAATRPALEGDPNRYAAKGKNPDGGLTVAEARRQGIRAGSETAAEAKKSGGFSKIEGKTQKRRENFCDRMCGAAKKHPEAAKDPKSRIRSALRIWGCRCGARK